MNKNVFEIPAALQEKADEINKDWLTHHQLRCEVYNTQDTREEWRFRVVRSTPTALEDENQREVLLQWLHPDYADGHTYWLACHAIDNARNAGFRRGVAYAAANLALGLSKQLDVTTEDFMKEIAAIAPTRRSR